jgi:hypothetical protein
MPSYKPGDILIVRVLSTKTPSVLKAELVSDKFQKCTLVMHRVKPPKTARRKFNWASFAAMTSSQP